VVAGFLSQSCREINGKEIFTGHEPPAVIGYGRSNIRMSRREIVKPTRVFIHGLESTSQGTKGVYFHERYPGMIIEDYTGPLAARMEKLEAILAGKDGLIIVGSSYGGLMAAIYACRHPEKVRRLILLAPAINLEEFSPYAGQALTMPVHLYHGRGDDVVPPGEVLPVAEAVFTELTYSLVDDDHSLHETFPGLPWDELLKD
jgi:pimeloyl-ACP methyl ester carboxylesterase